jgi:hypothetical protein
LVKVQKFSKDIGAPQVLHVAKNLDVTSHTSNIHIPFQHTPSWRGRFYINQIAIGPAR